MDSSIQGQAFEFPEIKNLASQEDPKLEPEVVVPKLQIEPQMTEIKEIHYEEEASPLKLKKQNSSMQFELNLTEAFQQKGKYLSSKQSNSSKKKL